MPKNSLDSGVRPEADLSPGTELLYHRAVLELLRQLIAILEVDLDSIDLTQLPEVYEPPKPGPPSPVWRMRNGKVRPPTRAVRERSVRAWRLHRSRRPGWRTGTGRAPREASNSRRQGSKRVTQSRGDPDPPPDDEDDHHLLSGRRS